MKKRRKFKDPTKRKVIIQKTTTGFMMKFWKLRIYFANKSLCPKKRNAKERQKNTLRIIRLRKLYEGKGCELCGKYLTAETSELHHIKPQSLYPKLKYDPSNLMLLCHECHVGLHKEAQKKAYELLATF